MAIILKFAIKLAVILVGGCERGLRACSSRDFRTSYQNIIFTFLIGNNIRLNKIEILSLAFKNVLKYIFQTQIWFGEFYNYLFKDKHSCDV